MSRIIIPPPQADEVLVSSVLPGDWISDDRVRWHLVRAIDLVACTVTVGDYETDSVTLPIDPEGGILRLPRSDVPGFGFNGPLQDDRNDASDLG